MKAVEEMSREELAEALDAPLSPKIAADYAVAYANMKRARFLLPDGEIMEPKDYADALDALSASLKRHIETQGPIHVEGVGDFKLQNRSLAWSWDIKSMAENDMKLLARLLELGAVTLNTKVAEELEKAGQITGFKGYGYRGGTTALVWEKAR